MLLFIFFHIHTFPPLVLGHKTNHSQSFNTAVYISLHNWLLFKTNYVTRRKTCIKPIVNDSSFVFRALINHRGYSAEKALIHFKKITKGPWLESYVNVYWVLFLTMTIYILWSLFPQFFGPWLCPLMFIIYSEPEFVGRDSCYKLLPQHFFVNFQIKSIKLCNELKVGATDLTEPAQTQISTFRFFTMKYRSSTSGPTGIKNWRSRWITDFNIQIFHNWNINPEHTYKYKGQQGSKSEQADW